MYLAVLADNPADEVSNMLTAIAIILICFVLYFLPTINGWSKSDRWSIAAINLFLGWTLVGWVVALAWALRGEKPTQVIMQNPSAAVVCPTCGKWSQGGSNFCSQCGMKWAVR